MSRKSKSGIDGISITKIKLAGGRVSFRAFVLTPSGKYESTNYPTEREARRGAIETLRGFNQTAVSPVVMTTPIPHGLPTNSPLGNASAPVWFAPLCLEYARMQRIVGSTEARAVAFEVLARAIDRAGWGNLTSGTFGKDALAWLAGLSAGWCNIDPSWKGRRKNRTELTNRYRNDLLEKINCVIRNVMLEENSPILRNPLLRKPGKTQLSNFKVQKKMIPTFQVSELRAMVSDTMRWHPWHLPACLLVYTGCRAQEAMFARWEWCDWDARVIKLQYYQDEEGEDEADLKTGERVIPMQEELYDVLQSYSPKKEGFIVELEQLRTNGSLKKCKRTKPVKHAYTQGLRLYCKACDFDPGKLRVHSLRHNYAAIMLAMGTNQGDVQDALGHKDYETTQGYAKMKSTFSVAVKHWPKGQYRLRTDATPIPFTKAN